MGLLNVAELIEQLKQVPPDTLVETRNRAGDWSLVESSPRVVAGAVRIGGDCDPD